MLKNTIANFIGRFWSVLSNFLFIPLYIKLLGFDNYSIISFTLVIAGVMAVLDGGLTATLSREFSRTDISNNSKVKTFQTLETLYFLIAAFIILFLFGFSSYISAHWLKGTNNDSVPLFIKIISFDIAFQMMLRFYMGGLLGIEKQVHANILQMIWGMFRNGMVLLPMIFFPRLDYFFLWQSISTIIFGLLFRMHLTKSICGTFLSFPNFKIHKDVLKSVGKFAGGMMLISVVAALNTQLDKISISRLLNITELGYYTLGASLATGVVVLINPIATATLPRLTSLYSENKKNEAITLFKDISKFSSLLISVVLSIMVVFAEEILWIWTGDHLIASKSFRILQIIAVAYSLVAFVMIPYNIAIANGHTKINNYLGIFSLVITIPGYWLLAARFGAEGVALLFASVQFVVTVVFLFLTNRKFLNIENFTFFLVRTFLFPVLFAILCSFIGKTLLEQFLSINRSIALILIIIFTAIIITIIIIMFVPFKDLVEYKNKLLKRK